MVNGTFGAPCRVLRGFAKSDHNPWVPREGIDRQTYLETKFGSVDRYSVIAERIVQAAALEGREAGEARLR